MYISYDRKAKASQNGELGLKLKDCAAVRVNRNCKNKWNYFR